MPSVFALASDQEAGSTGLVLAHSGKLTSRQAKRFAADLASLPPVARDIVDDIDVCGRYETLDMVDVTLRDGPDAVSEILGFGGGEDKQYAKSYRALVSTGLVDWDEILRSMNRDTDQWVAAARLPSRAQQVRAILRLDKSDDEKRIAPLTADEIGRRQKSGKLSSEVATAAMLRLFDFDDLLGLEVPPTMVIDMRDRAQANCDMRRIAFLLAAYRADHDEYPAKLSQLRPDYLRKLPLDPFSAKPYQYRRGKQGYLLYSVDRNGKDDGGRRSFLDEEKDFDYIMQTPDYAPAE